VSQGTVKWYSNGYGVIAQDEGPDRFFLKSRLAPDVVSVSQRDAVEFDVRDGCKAPEAYNVRPANGQRPSNVGSSASDAIVGS